MTHSARTRWHTRQPGPSHPRRRHIYEKGSREPPPGKPEERRRGFRSGQLLHLLEFDLRLRLTAQRTPQTAQAIMSIGLGRVDANRLAELAGRFVESVLCGEKNTQ